MSPPNLLHWDKGSRWSVRVRILPPWGRGVINVPQRCLLADMREAPLPGRHRGFPHLRSPTRLFSPVFPLLRTHSQNSTMHERTLS